MEEVNISGGTYYFVKGYRDDDKFRKSFNKLAEKIHGINFEEWYRKGYWNDRYIPYSILCGNDIISNVSVNVMDFNAFGKSKRFIQIGTVMTDSKYRDLGLSRFLMERVICEWKDRCSLIYLFANDTVLDFYPKFGFNKAEEYQYSKNIVNDNLNIQFEKLNMDDVDKRKFVCEKIKNSIEYSKLAMEQSVDLIMFYSIGYMKENVYYIKDYDIIVFAEFNVDTLIIMDIYGENNIRLDTIINALADENIKHVILGFAPSDEWLYDIESYHEENTTLFVMGTDSGLFKENKLKFSPLSHA